MDPLGKGLESLIPDKSDDFSDVLVSSQKSDSQKPDDSIRSERDSIFWIEVDKIEPNPYQPRREFNEEALKDLASSIREHGVVQPVLVSRIEAETPRGLDVRYQLIAGERRLRASQLVGLRLIPAVIRRREPDNRLKLEIALIENIQREDLNIMEKARAYKRLVDEFHLVQREVAEKVGKSREAVANTIRLLNLPEEIQQALIEGRITEGHARAILMVGSDPERQHIFFNEIVTTNLNSRDSEVRSREILGRPVRKMQPRVGTVAADPEIRLVESRLEEALGTRVSLQKKGEKGKIVVEFFSEEELRGILDKLTKQNYIGEA